MSETTPVLSSELAFTTLCSRLNLPYEQVALIISKIASDVPPNYESVETLDRRTQENAIADLALYIQNISTKVELLEIKLAERESFSGKERRYERTDNQTLEVEADKDKSDANDSNSNTATLLQERSANRQHINTTLEQQQEPFADFLRLAFRRFISKDKPKQIATPDNSQSAETTTGLPASSSADIQAEELDKFRALTIAEAEQRALKSKKSQPEMGD
ncbi:MAG: hypothetical protein CLLPBCKN_007640 [Chroococcidiopsis cubana SAG 39.79]|uniref:Uncharacterized protein n=1 Tax=Chroococcidiopsis cubana SAG 39.79 TaxID=388085 RepID=A0AB37UTD6_9CYAN|nr:hypothetical protein [Chroococcidiopsis cubana]MDZ4878205.1 hypothetical protein [Chroococcidiopsis cubana SAG 39.79]PSB66578.1 hypothetical protein C7B79_00550 [Chroococcidiopsis cubana CCALA 043]RUT14534.1 hypothetical protein DSM107010_00800 [Chroococcidiopsis cubana SAG 39.79]